MEFQPHLSSRKCHSIQFKITGFLHFTIRHWHLRNDGLTYIRLPDTNRGQPVDRNTVGIHQTITDRKPPNSGGQITTVPTPVNKMTVDGYLTKEIVDIVIGHSGF